MIMIDFKKFPIDYRNGIMNRRLNLDSNGLIITTTDQKTIYKR